MDRLTAIYGCRPGDLLDRTDPHAEPSGPSPDVDATTMVTTQQSVGSVQISRGTGEVTLVGRIPTSNVTEATLAYLESATVTAVTGWLRVFGSGNTDRSLADIVTANPVEPTETLVAVDVLGGQLVWGRSAAKRPPTIHYFGPDTLDWQDLEVGYQSWLYAVLAGSLDQFYETLRWPGWEAEVAACPLNQGINTFPPPFTEEGKDLATASRKPISMTELTSYYAGTAWQLG